jgi:hypothetical protein
MSDPVTIVKSLPDIPGNEVYKLRPGKYLLTLEFITDNSEYIEYSLDHGTSWFRIQKTTTSKVQTVIDAPQGLWYNFENITSESWLTIEEVGQSTNPFFSLSYEQGAFTPTISGGTSNPTCVYSAQSGFYTLIGDQVFFTLRIGITSISDDGVGQFEVDGLPYTAFASSLYKPLLSFAWDGVNWNNVDKITPFIYQNSTKIRFVLSVDDVAWVDQMWTATLIEATDDFIITGNYRKA